MGNPFATPDPNRDKNEPSETESDDRPRKKLPLENEPPPKGLGAAGPDKPRQPMTPSAARSAMIYLLVLMVAIFMVTMTFPWNIVGAIAAVAALVMGVRNLVRSRDPKYQGISRFMTIVTLAMASFALLTGLTSFMLIGPQIEAQKCMGEAITTSAQRACQAEYKRAQEEIVNRFTPFPTAPTSK